MIGARVWKFGDDVNTDLMLPGPLVHEPLAQQLRAVFGANRPGWVDQMRHGDAIVAGTNFGMGSARPAPRVLRELGIAFVAAEQVNGLFLRSCVNLGLVAIDCPGVTAAFEEGDLADFDTGRWLLTNTRTGQELRPLPVPPRFLELMQQGGIYPLLEAEGFLAHAPTMD